MIMDAYVRMRTIDQTIPDDVLDFMKDAAIESLMKINREAACNNGNHIGMSRKKEVVLACGSCGQKWFTT